MYIIYMDILILLSCCFGSDIRNTLYFHSFQFFTLNNLSFNRLVTLVGVYPFGHSCRCIKTDFQIDRIEIETFDKNSKKFKTVTYSDSFPKISNIKILFRIQYFGNIRFFENFWNQKLIFFFKCYQIFGSTLEIIQRF